MSRLSTIARTSIALAVCACASGTASKTPSAATLALYDVNAARPASAAAPATAPRVTDASSSGVAPLGDFVRSRNPQLQYCYEETRAKHPALAGSATIGVMIAADGSVSRVDVLRRSWQGSGADRVEACVLDKVRTWKFPTDGTTARPYSFLAVFTR
ncbi:MAG TPA: AgmX/PglI C-terminal domain-containing protein [Gemmatimonadaceae bacterium]|nr:AgmX/PglI C-terminal domain-containing protein [Gemmatimonadaceae bacterium]